MIFLAGFGAIVRRAVRLPSRPVDAAEDEGALFAAAVAQARDMVFIARGEDRRHLVISFANAAMENELGYERGELIGKPPSIAFGARTDRETIARISQRLADQQDAEGEFLAYRKDGTTFWSEWRGRAVASGSGARHTWVAIGRNIDQRRRNEEELARLSAAVEHASDAIYIYSMREGGELPRLRYLNAAATALSGFRIGDPQARMARFDPSATTTIREIASRMRAGQAWHDWVKMRRADGGTYWADVHLKPLADRNGKFTQWVSIERDVTGEIERARRLDDERAALELLVECADGFLRTLDPDELHSQYAAAARERPIEESSQAQRLLERIHNSAQKNVQLYAELTAGRDALAQSEALRKDLMSMIAHDIRGPLTGLLGMGELYLEGLIPSDEIPETIATMVRSGRRLAGVADELSMFARLEQGDFKPDRRPVDVFAMLTDVATYLPGGERIDTRCDGEPVIETDAVALRHIIENLLGNALKYSPRTARVTATLRCARGTATLQIADRGIGIPDADLPHVFERRTRASNAGSITGTGLGLSFVQRLVTACGGTIAVTSTVDVGSTFVVTLPRSVA